MKQKLTWVSLGTLAVGMAVMLQVEDPCTMDPPADTRLAVLEVEVDGENLLEFDPNTYSYEVMLPEGAETVTVRAQAMHEEMHVMYNHAGQCPPPITHGHLEEGETSFALEEMPEGHSLLKVSVQAPGGRSRFYGVYLTRPVECV